MQWISMWGSLRGFTGSFRCCKTSWIACPRPSHMWLIHSSWWLSHLFRLRNARLGSFCWLSRFLGCSWFQFFAILFRHEIQNRPCGVEKCNFMFLCQARPLASWVCYDRVYSGNQLVWLKWPSLGRICKVVGLISGNQGLKNHLKRRKSANRQKKCNLTLAMSPTCHCNNP